MKEDMKKAWETLILRYENITLSEIENAMEKEKPLIYLTGFGNVSTCLLCQTCKKISTNNATDCKHCAWSKYTNHPCDDDCNAETFNAIENAKNPTEILEAYRNRAKRMREVENEK